MGDDFIWAGCLSWGGRPLKYPSSIPPQNLPQKLFMRALAPLSGNRRGFSLTELMVVMGIIAMILGFAAPAIVGVLKGKKVEQAIGALSGILESARMDAITQNSYYWTGVCIGHEPSFFSGSLCLPVARRALAAIRASPAVR